MTDNSYFDGVIDDYIADSVGQDDDRVKIGDTFYLRVESSNIPLVLVDYVGDTMGKFAYEKGDSIKTIKLPFEATM